MAEQKKRDRKRYLRDFKQTADGSYAYTGKMWHAEPALRRRFLLKLWALQGVMLFAAIFPGFVTTAGLLNTFYVIIPYVFWLISDFYLAYTLGNITFGGNPLRDYTYDGSVAKYAFRTIPPFIGALLTAVSLAVFLLRGGTGEGIAACFLCCVGQMAASFFAKRSEIKEIWSADN